MAIKLNPDNIITSGVSKKQVTKLNPDQIIVSQINKSVPASTLPTPSEVAKILRDDPAANIKKHQQNIDALTRIPSRHYNADVAKAVREINRPSIYEYNQNSLNPLERVVVGSAAEKVRENKLLDLTAEEKKTLAQIAENMKKQYGASALYEYTGKEDIDMFDALWWITGAYQRTNSQSQAIYEGKKLERSNRKKTEFAVLASDDFMEKVKKGTEYAKPQKQTENAKPQKQTENGGNFVERFVSDYLIDNGSGGKEEKRNKAFAQKVASGEGIYAYMTVDEKSVYYYFLGSNKNKAAADYIADLKPELEGRKARAEADDNGFLENTLDAVGTGFVTGATNIARSTSALKAATNQDMSELEKSVFDTTYQEKLWSEIQENSEDRTLVGNLWLKIVNSVASQAPAIAVGYLTGGTGYFTTMTMGSIGGSTTEATNSGYSAQQGFIHGVVNAALEIITDKTLGGVGSLLSGGKSNSLVKAAISAIDSKVANKAIANWLSKSTIRAGAFFSEGFEELLQELLEPIIRNTIYAENNKYSAETFKNALEAFIVGAFSGEIMVSPSVNSALSRTRLEILGNHLEKTSGIKSVLDLARLVGNDSALFMEVEEKYNNGKKIDSADVGNLYLESFNEFKNPNSKMAQAFVERNVDNVIAEAKAMRRGEQTDINSDLQSTAETSPTLTEAEQKIVNTPDNQLTPEQRAVKETLLQRTQNSQLQSTAETVAEDSETALDKASELLENIVDSDGLTEKQTDKISLEPKNPNKNHLDAATQKVYRDVTSKLGTEIVYEDVAAVLKGEGYEIDENNSPDGYIGSDGKIHLSYYSTNPTNFVLKHELTHYGERYNKEGYETYISAIDKSEAFKKWLQEKTGSKSESLGALKGLYRDGVTKSRGKLAPQSIAKLNSEMYADFSGEVVFNEQRFDKLVNEINAKDRPKVIQFIIDFFKKIRDILPKTLKGEIKSLESKYVEMLREAKNNLTEQNGGVEFSFAGQKSRTANYSKLDEAIKMEDVGKATSEEIRQQTGWFRGYDGKWRFEISDRDMDFNINGHFTNPDVIRHRELEYKFITDTENITEAEINELKALSKTLEGVRKRPTKLGDYLKHNKLFEAYPELKDFKLSFEKFEDGSIGEYRSNKKEIVLDNSLKDDISRLRKTLAH
ncbi:MAG: hypothetical protein II306_04045, partial [Clostridia bacterium]|nr:hypothetical protein [Clostridia bacterium]